ncbi:TerB family tellurite resistance protein [Tenacibaculum sp. TC6]|uniref:TerB family tellurite resistance protein n=1 Tax=Tenacibaculum sp. TC6 TaxID=3423223 RepID=UPI003D35C232
MSFSDLFKSGGQTRNMLHFAVLAKIAHVDGEINETEQEILNKFAKKLSIGKEQAEEVLAHLDQYPLPSVAFKQERLEYLFELFQVIYADHEIDELEEQSIYKYAIALGFNEEEAKRVIEISIKIFGGKISLEDYLLFHEFLAQKK